VVKYSPGEGQKEAADDLRAFEVVAMLGVRNPNVVNAGRPPTETLWERLRPYLRTGGKLIIMPPPDTNIDLAAYNSANDIMPGQLRRVIETRKMDPPPPEQKGASWPTPREGKNGVTWVMDEKALQNPFLKPLEEWRQREPNLGFITNPRITWKFWELDPDKASTPDVFYNDSADPAKRHPAILERPVTDPKDANKPKGKVVLLTVRMDKQSVDDEWHNYWVEGTFFAEFPYLLVRYLAGDTADANFNYATGATVPVPLPRGRFGRDAKVALDGPPGTAGSDALITPGEKQTEIRVGPPKTNVPGNFTLSVSVEKNGALETLWKDGFSTNVPPEEFNLEKVPVEQLEDLVGKDRMVPVDRNVSLAEIITGKIGHPVDLFPWLLIMVLLLFVAEGLAANRFYRRPK
jgi:hypothetical protein